MVPSSKAIQMIEQFETGGNYQTKAVWPGGQSGVTIGIGFDLGYATLGDLIDFWADLITDASTYADMKKCVGVTGLQAKVLLPQVHISIPYTFAKLVYEKRTIPKYSQMTYDAFPNCINLNGDSFGALVSLVINRGPGMVDAPGEDNRLEMRQIRDAMASLNFAAVPDMIRSMKRLWPVGLDGLLKRRAAEDDLFQLGLEDTSAQVS